MKLARALLRVLVACVFSAWVLLLWSGINLWQVGIQQQIDGCRGDNSFPYESFGKSCVQWACLWGFFHCLVFRFGVSAGKGKVSWNSRLFTTRNEITISHMCLCGDSVSMYWKILNFIIPQNLQGTRDKCCLASKEWPSGGDS